jgi:hypothetical protein
MSSPHRLRLFPFLAFLIFLPFVLGAAEVSIPSLELMTWGRMVDDSFGLYSRAYMQLLIEGGETYGARVELEFDDRDLEKSRTLDPVYNPDNLEQALEKTLLFKSISVEICNLFNTPINLVYFTGATDVFCSGDVFPKHFESEPVASHVKGYSYFPTGVLYDGIHAVRGTGFKLHTPDLSDRMNFAVYAYQDEYLGQGRYSSDLRAMFNTDSLKIEAFWGATYPLSDYGIYRGGLLFFYSTGLGGEFFTQIGIPRWDPSTDNSFNIDLFYFLFEPRVRINLFSIILTFFWRPEYYHQQRTLESGDVDILISFMYGDKEKTSVSGGIENQLSLQTREGEQISFRISPFLSLVTSGVIWDFKINTRLYPYRIKELVEVYVGVKTEL